METLRQGRKNGHEDTKKKEKDSWKHLHKQGKREIKTLLFSLLVFVVP